MAMRKAFQTANQRARRLQLSIPKAVSAHYDRKNRRVVIGLSSNVEVGFSPHDAQGLESARPSQLEEIEVSPSGFGIHFPRLDADLYLPAILQGVLGSRKWMASRLGQTIDQSSVSGQGLPDEILPAHDSGHARPNKRAPRFTARLVEPLNASFYSVKPLDASFDAA
ncbi:MAG TPA: DUF2442 domain-containing protein [Terriglobia bacterium]